MSPDHMSLMMVTISKWKGAGGREQQLHGKINWSSLFCERDEVNRKHVNTRTLTGKKDQEVVWHINRYKDSQLRQTQI